MDDRPVIGPELRERLAEGYAAVAATSDERLRPELARVWGMEVSPDGRQLTFCVEAPPGSRMRANLERGSKVALTATKPTTYRSMQVKGPLRGVWEATEADIARARAQRDAFATNVVPLGIEPARGVRFIREDALFTAVIDVEELYDQTPGPAAGSRL
jgi:hypothetical protein